MVLLSIAELAVELRIIGDAGEELDEGNKQIVENLLAFSRGMVDQRAPLAPEWAKNEAMIRIAAYRYDAPTSPVGTGFADILTNSGAAEILAPWTPIRALRIEDNGESQALDNRSEAYLRRLIAEELSKYNPAGTDADSVARAGAAYAQELANDAQDDANAAQEKADEAKATAESAKTIADTNEISLAAKLEAGDVEAGDGIEIEELESGLRIINTGEVDAIFTRTNTFPAVDDAQYDRLYSVGSNGRNNRLGYLRHQTQTEIIITPERWENAIGFHDGEHDLLYPDAAGFTRGELLPATVRDDGDPSIRSLYQSGQNVILNLDKRDLRWHEGGSIADTMWIFTRKESDASATITTTLLNIIQDTTAYRVFRRNDVSTPLFVAGERYHVSFRLGGTGTSARVNLHDGSHVVRLVDDTILGALKARVLALESRD